VYCLQITAVVYTYVDTVENQRYMAIFQEFRLT